MTALAFTATEFTTFDRAALADVFDHEAAATAREFADAAYATYLVATVYDGILPGVGSKSPTYIIGQIAEFAADAEAAAAHTELGAREYPAQFDHLASAAKYAARMASALLDGMASRLADLDAAA